MLLYLNEKGRYQKAYNFLFSKLIPKEGSSSYNLGEILRLVNYVYYRYSNSGDSYESCIERKYISYFSNKKFPFNKEYSELGVELERLLYDYKYDEAVDMVLLQIMLKLSNKNEIYNPESNRLVSLNSEKGAKALKSLNLNCVFVNYCGKNQGWLPESLRKDGVRITKLLSESTKKELDCDTIPECSHTKKPDKILVFSEGNIKLSKKISNIQKEQRKNKREQNKKYKEMDKQRMKSQKRKVNEKIKKYNEYVMLSKKLSEFKPRTRIDLLLKKYGNIMEPITRMLVHTLAEIKNNTINTESAQDKKVKIGKIIDGLLEIGKEKTELLKNIDSKNTIYSSDISVSENINIKLEKMLVDIYGNDDVVNYLYKKVSRKIYNH